MVALGYTFFGMAGSGERMTLRNVTSYNQTKARNSAHTGIQVAIQKYNESEETWTGPETVTLDEASLTISLEHVGVDTIKITSRSSYRNSEHTVISTYDISKQLQVVPEFKGAISGIGSNKNIEFQDGNSKVHFNGIPPAGTPCPDMPGFTVQDAGMVDKYDDMPEIAGSPSVAVDNTTPYSVIGELINALEPQATVVDKGDEFTSDPGVYFINDYTQLSGQIEGSGILVVRNDGVLDIAAELAIAGQFTFNGLVIFENGSNFQGTGKAQFNGTVLAASEGTSTFNIKANGNFEAQYDCTTRQYAEEAVKNALYTTIYRELSVYE